MRNTRQTIKHLKGWMSAVVVAGLVSSASATTVTVNPGDAFIPAANGTGPVGATTLFTTNVDWGQTFSFAGTLTSSVLTNDTSNPYGGLTFTYIFSVTNGSHPVDKFSVGNYSTFLTDLSYVGGTGKTPVVFNRSFESLLEGDTLGFDFSGVLHMVTLGTNSALLVVQTDAHNWAASIASILNSSAAADIPTLAPVSAVPEPTTLSLMGLGIATFMCLKRRKSDVRGERSERRVCSIRKM